MTDERAGDRVLRVVVQNGTKHPTRLLLRPFGAYYDMDVGVSYEVRARGPATGTLTVEQVEGGSIVTGWPGCILSVHTLKRVGGPRLEQPSPMVAPTIALLKRMRGEDDDDDDETLA